MVRKVFLLVFFFVLFAGSLKADELDACIKKEEIILDAPLKHLDEKKAPSAYRHRSYDQWSKHFTWLGYRFL